METAKLFKSLKADHMAVGKELLAEALFPLDFLAVAVLNRSLCNASAFTTLVEAKNIIAAAPFIRFQIDNSLRFYASSLVDDPHGFAMAVMGGTQINRLKDRNGKKLTDRYLRESLISDARFPLQRDWLEAVYDQVSGYVHFSEKHVFGSVKAGEALKFQMKISAVDAYVTPEVYEEGAAAFLEATNLTLKLVGYWACQKNRAEHKARLSNASPGAWEP